MTAGTPDTPGAPPPARPPAPTPAGTPCSKNAGHTVSCQECAEFLLDYIDGVLPEAKRRDFDAHLAVCRDCQVYLDNYRKAAALTTGLARADRIRAGETVPERLVQAILRAGRRASENDRHGSQPPPGNPSP